MRLMGSGLCSRMGGRNATCRATSPWDDITGLRTYGVAKICALSSPLK